MAEECSARSSRTPCHGLLKWSIALGVVILGQCHCYVITVYPGEGWCVEGHRFLSYNWEACEHVLNQPSSPWGGKMKWDCCCFFV